MQPYWSCNSPEKNMLTSKNLLQGEKSNIQKIDVNNKLEWK